MQPLFQKSLPLKYIYCVLVRYFTAAVLFCASILKLDAPVPDWFAETIPMATILWPLVAFLEFALAALLSLQRVERISLKAAAGFFALLGTVALLLSAAKGPTCNCFGEAHIAPIYTGVFDGCMCVALVFASRFAFEDALDARPATRLIALVTAVAASLLLATAVRHFERRPGFTIFAGKEISLDPTHWIGQQFPLLEYLDSEVDLFSGDRFVILARSECRRCHEVASQLSRVNASDRAPVVIEIDGHTSTARFWPCPGVRLRSDITWHVATPFIINIKEGRVASAQFADDHWTAHGLEYLAHSLKGGG